MDMPPDLDRALPGVAGSLTALLFFRSSWKRALGMFVAGVAAAKILGPAASLVMHAGPEVGGYVTGLFGMAVVAKLFDVLQSFDSAAAARDIWTAVVDRIRGRKARK